MLLVKSSDPSTESNFSVAIHRILLFTSVLYFPLCLFVFASHSCTPLRPPLAPHRLALSAARHPAMLNPRSRDRWRKRVQTSLPISRSSRLGAIIMANSSPSGPGSRKRSETGKVKSVQCLNTFCCRICLDLVYCLTLSIFCLTGNCWCAFPLSTHHETGSMYF